MIAHAKISKSWKKHQIGKREKADPSSQVGD